MSDVFKYSPIIRWKRGEQQALQNLRPEDKFSARPLVELLPESVEDDDPTGSYDKFVKQLDKSWGRESPVFVDLGPIEGSDASHPVQEVFERIRSTGLLGIPVTGVDRDEAFQAAIAAVAKGDRRGVLIRVTPEEIAEERFAEELTGLVKKLGVVPNDVDIVFDGGFIQSTPQMSVSSQAFTTMGFLSSLPNLRAWRTVTCTASAFPENLASITGEGTIPRTEWNVWKNVAARLSGVRDVLFGDYAIAHPIYSSVPYVGAASIRYTIDESWLIERGRKLTDPRHGQYNQYVTLSQKLIADKRFSGADFSWGDWYIQSCADGEVGTGNMTTWRAVATNHHIRYVLRQLASLGAPSSAS